MKEQRYATLTDMGYVIVNLSERTMHLHTLSSNRKDAWNKFCPANMRSAWQKNGMQCVYVTLEGGFWCKVLPEETTA